MKAFHLTPLATACALAAFVSGPAAHAAVSTTGCGDSSTTCTLTQLYAPGSSITAGDLVFSNFSLELDLGSLSIDPSVITLTGVDTGSLNPGSGFRLNGNGEIKVSGNDDIIYIFNFDVAYKNDLSLLKDASLTAGSITTGDDAAWSVSARIFAPIVPELAIEKLPPIQESRRTASISRRRRPPLACAWHSTRLTSCSTAPTDITEIGDYTFLVSSVPEPTALPLMLTGLAAVLSAARRRA